MRIVRRWPYAAAAALACAACAPAPTVRRLDQPFTNIEICRLEENRLPGRAGLRFDLERADTGQAGPPVYEVLLRTVGARPIPVRPTAPLRLSLGADSLVLLPADSTVQRAVLHTELLSTSIRYAVELEALRRVGDASEARLAVDGPFGVVGARLSPENLEAVRRFLGACTAERPLPPSPDSSAAGPSGRGPGD
jgi:hypothetical protein